MCPDTFEGIARRLSAKLDQLEAATSLRDLDLPGDRLEALKGERKGEYSIRVSDQWRICFEWPKGPRARIFARGCRLRLRARRRRDRSVSIGVYAWLSRSEIPMDRQEHLGIQVEDRAELAEVYQRLRHAEGTMIEEGETTCCYAQSEKSWIDDPQGVLWETFLTTGESTVYGTDEIRPKAQRQAKATCCAPGQCSSSTA